MGWTAIVLAGSRPGVDPFAAEHGTDLKALIPVNGKPLVRWPVEALLDSNRIASVRVVAQQPDRIAQALPEHPKLTVEPSGQTIAATLEALCFDPAVQWPLLVTTADHALLDRDMIRDFCAGAEGADIAIGVVEEREMRERLPQAQRTWIRFRGGAYSGANLFSLSSRKVVSALELWRGVEQDRKKVARLLWMLGPFAFAGAMLRLRTLNQTLESVSRSLDLEIRAVEMCDPLAAVDVDKASDHRLVETVLSERQ